MTTHTSSLLSQWEDDPRKLMTRALAIGRESCTCDGPYHVWWPLLRAAGAVGVHRAREDDALSAILRPLVADGTRILIAGSGDAGTLCTIGRICDPLQPHFTVLDRCPAPLRLVQEFATERNISCRTLLSDLSRYSEESRWDIVIAHFTFQFIVPEERFNVLERLSRSLVPGGTLVCVNKEVPPISAADASAAAEAWYQKNWRKVQAEGLESALPAPLCEQVLRRAAEGRSRRLMAISSIAELVEGTRRAGLILTGEDLVGTTQAHAQATESCIILAASRPGQSGARR
jgi:hypothetical protein